MRNPNRVSPIVSISAHREVAGFTLVELMITVAILAILAAIAYPAMSNMIRNHRVMALATSIQADLLYARGQAAATRSYVSICPVANAGGTTCAPSSGTYDNGWLIYVSASANTAYDGTAANLLRVEQATSNASLRSSINGVLTYNSRGLLLSGNDQQASSDVIFDACSKSAPTDTIGVNTGSVSGISVTAAGSGRVSSFSLAAGAACTP